MNLSEERKSHQNFNDKFETVSPKSDIFETQNEFVLMISLPAIDLEDIKYEMVKNILTVFARAKESNQPSEKLVYGEFMPKNYKRAFVIATEIDESKITAEFVNGVLKLTLPKI